MERGSWIESCVSSIRYSRLPLRRTVVRSYGVSGRRSHVARKKYAKRQRRRWLDSESGDGNRDRGKLRRRSKTEEDYLGTCSPGGKLRSASFHLTLFQFDSSSSFLSVPFLPSSVSSREEKREKNKFCPTIEKTFTKQFWRIPSRDWKVFPTNLSSRRTFAFLSIAYPVDDLR